MSIPRPEHPMPQFMRKDWVNLNGTWSFEMDFPDSGFEQGFFARVVRLRADGKMPGAQASVIITLNGKICCRKDARRQSFIVISIKNRVGYWCQYHNSIFFVQQFL